jgi:hypothetical protein
VKKANLTQHSKVALSQQDINKFFHHCDTTAAGIPPKNSFNCNESNLQDDPGAWHAIFKKREKYAEQVRDYSKSCISLMACSNIPGIFLPPCTVYKRENVYSSWCTDGTKRAIYTSSP